MAEARRTATSAGRWLIVAYAGLAYVMFLASFTCFIAFAIPAPLPVPVTVDQGLWASSTSPLAAAAFDLALIALFGLQHSLMARRSFKDRLVQLVPPAAERATYVLISSLTLLILMAFWQPLPATLWSVSGTAAAALYAVNLMAWGLAIAATFMINHFDLFGLKQAWLHLVERTAEPDAFTTRFAYRFVRHPLQAGIFFGLWIVPGMTLGHLILSAGLTAYILAGTRLEERDLITTFGDQYRQYRQRVPMLIPWRPR